MNKLKTLLIAPLLALTVSTANAQTVKSWDALQTAYAAYVKNTKAENINNVEAAIDQCAKDPVATPVSSYVESRGVEAQRAAGEYIMSHLNVLQKRVNVGDEASAGMAYQLLSISDSAFSEDLIEMMDRPIHKTPGFFLQELLANRKWVEKWGSVRDFITFMGSEFVDQAGQPQKEYRLRIRDLEKVKEPGMKEIQEECVKILAGEIRKAE